MAEPDRPTGYLIDSNVLLDVATEDPDWYQWSSTALSRAARIAPLVINPLIYAEVSANYDTIEELDDALPERLFRRLPLPYQAGFLAARAFLNYRSHGGARRSPLPDFYIGAHAAVDCLTLVTRDARRYRTYFPTVNMIAPAVK
ncbi:type II toxin-antitoxin system VapC family toxin [Mycobacterium sp.]|uniref:type II toxin-antitoxin system VapC family toxin n=1 Tax=Mycobacterium sp. TaxID=1785 RepID=UPI0031DCB923